MKDTLAAFALQGEPAGTLGIALGRCFAEYNAWHCHAMLVAGFAQDAAAGGVKGVLASRLHQMLDFGEAEGFIYSTSAKTKSNREIAQVLADHQLGMADHGVKIASIVMIHNAYERFLWRLVRFGLVGNRQKALKWIGGQTIPVDSALAKGIDACVDAHLEKWWEKLERDSLASKWDRLCGLFGCPEKLQDPPWHFDRQMIVRFDDVRHNAVHHDAQAVKSFDLSNFANQLYRAQLVWFAQVAQQLQVRVPAETMFTGK